jgi:hypothetical protein
VSASNPSSENSIGVLCALAPSDVQTNLASVYVTAAILGPGPMRDRISLGTLSHPKTVDANRS